MRYSRFKIYSIFLILSLYLSSCNKHPSLEKADELANKGYYRGAIRILNKILKKDPNNIEALSLFCGCQNGMGDYQSAVVACKQVVEAQPSDAQALFNLGMALYYSGEIIQGLEYGRSAFEHDPEFRELMKRTIDIAPPSLVVNPDIIAYGKTVIQSESKSDSLNVSEHHPVDKGDRTRFTEIGLSLIMPRDWKRLPTPSSVENVIILAETQIHNTGLGVAIYLKRNAGESWAKKYPNLPRLLMAKNAIKTEANALEQKLIKLDKIKVAGKEWYFGVKEVENETTMRMMKTIFWNDAGFFHVTAIAPSHMFESREPLFRSTIESIRIEK